MAAHKTTHNAQPQQGKWAGSALGAGQGDSLGHGRAVLGRVGPARGYELLIRGGRAGRELGAPVVGDARDDGGRVEAAESLAEGVELSRGGAG